MNKKNKTVNNNNGDKKCQMKKKTKFKKMY